MLASDDGRSVVLARSAERWLALEGVARSAAVTALAIMPALVIAGMTKPAWLAWPALCVAAWVFCWRKRANLFAAIDKRTNER